MLKEQQKARVCWAAETRARGLGDGSVSEWLGLYFKDFSFYSDWDVDPLELLEQLFTHEVMSDCLLWAVAHQDTWDTPGYMGFPKQEYWNG